MMVLETCSTFRYNTCMLLQLLLLLLLLFCAVVVVAMVVVVLLLLLLVSLETVGGGDSIAVAVFASLVVATAASFIFKYVAFSIATTAVSIAID